MYVKLWDGRRAQIELSWPVKRTPAPGFGWVAASWSYPEDTAHIVDFRGGSNLWEYIGGDEQSLHVPYREGYLDDEEQIDIMECNDSDFRTRVYNIEVEGFHTYYIGRLGVWVHNRKSSWCGLPR